MKKILFLLVVLLPLVADAQKAVVESYIKSLNNYCGASYDRRGSETMIESLFTYYQDDEEQWAKMNDEITRKVLELCYDRKIDTQRPCNVFSSDIEAPAYMQCFKWLRITQATIVSMNETRKSGFQCVTAIITYSGGVYANGHTMGQDFVISNGKIYRIDNNKFAYDQWRNGGFKSDNSQKSQPSQPSTTSTHQYVDLGLPSGTLWATCNVGANNPWEYGDYFAWGETKPKTTFSWKNYKYGNGSDYDISKKYNTKDNKKELERIDDAATQHKDWGSDWCMPTAEQRDELINNCYWVWTTTYKGHKVIGYIVYKALKESDKGKKIYAGSTPDASYSPDRCYHIFLPAAGSKGSDGKLSSAGSYGYYWSSSLDAVSRHYGRSLYFDSGGVGAGLNHRYYGFYVRAVRCK